MIKNLHFLLILDPKHDISKRHLKRRILVFNLRTTEGKRGFLSLFLVKPHF
jgi:hypothetical protein